MPAKPNPKKSAASANAKPDAPMQARSLSGLVKQLKTQPKPRRRIVDILAYAAVKHTHPVRLSRLSPEERNARHRESGNAYNRANAASRAIAELLADPDISEAQKLELDEKSHTQMEKLLLAKIAFTMDMLDIPATGSPESDIFAIGMQCIGNVDARFDAEPKLDPNLDKTSEAALAIATAKFFNLVLYDIKTEEVLKGRYPDMGAGKTAPASAAGPVIALANLYQSLFEIRMLGKKPVYRLKPDLFKNEPKAAVFEDSLELVEAELGLMDLRPETINERVEQGRALLEAANAPKPGLVGSLFKRNTSRDKSALIAKANLDGNESGETADSDNEDTPKPAKPWI